MKATHEPDRVHVRPILLTAAGVVSATTIGVLAAWWLTKNTATLRGPEEQAQRRPEAPAEVNAIEMALLQPRGAASARQPPGRQRLYEYGWVDKERGVLHVPIDRALDLYLDAGTGANPRPDAGAVPSPSANAGAAGKSP